MPIAVLNVIPKIYAETRQNVLENDIRHEVAILRDGFSQFQLNYKVRLVPLFRAFSS